MVIIVWLFIMAFPVVAFTLSTRGQINLGNEQGNHIRIFLLQEVDNEGVGFEWTRETRRSENCLTTSINYLMWDGEGEPVTFCQCFDATTGAPLPSEQNRCE